MNWQILYLAGSGTGAITSLVIAYYAWRQRSRPGAGLFAWMNLAAAEYVITAALMHTAATPAQALVWVNPHYFGLTSLLACFLLFVLHYTGHARWLSRTGRAVVISIPFLTQIVIETNPLHHLFIQDIQFSRDGLLMALHSIQYGWLFWVHSAYSYGVVLLGLGLIGQMSVRTFRLYRAQSLTLFVALLFPLLASLNDSRLFFAGFPYPLVPLGFVAMDLAFAWDMFLYKMLSIVPVARDRLVESMSDSLIVLDAATKVVDLNPAAQRLLHAASEEVIGQAAGAVLAGWPDWVTAGPLAQAGQGELTLPEPGAGLRYYDLRTSGVPDDQGRITGRIIVLRDVTEKKLAELKLQETLAEVQTLQAQLYEQAIRDPLTGLHNRRYLFEVQERELARAVRAQQPLSVVLLDIDHFKSVNDTYGHESGDQVIRGLARVLARASRAGDTVFRYGGEEFLVLLPATSAAAAAQSAERWRASVEAERIAVAGHTIAFTISLGVAMYPAHGETLDAVLAQADAALYQAKGSGRNRVVVAGDTPAPAG